MPFQIGQRLLGRDTEYGFDGVRHDAEMACVRDAWSVVFRHRGKTTSMQFGRSLLGRPKFKKGFLGGNGGKSSKLICTKKTIGYTFFVWKRAKLLKVYSYISLTVACQCGNGEGVGMRKADGRCVRSIKIGFAV